ncbi:hypothetical protein RhiirA4_202531 [Rhizophagus irregularis]|uniref:Uncharacterized protein n=1 Tax=Rhizophagus irregularis TaxID=588596 RepID=A0A2I1GKD1_9GLOM|nr:hypothetical protein RhiirA4_202531 [Rhizophagus irregularis]
MDTISWFVSDFLSVVVSAFVRELATVCPINYLSFPLVYSFFPRLSLYLFFPRLSLLPSSIPSSPSIPSSLVYFFFPRLSLLPSSISSSLVYPFFPRLSLLPSSISSSLVYPFFPVYSFFPRLFLPSSIPFSLVFSLPFSLSASFLQKLSNLVQIIVINYTLCYILHSF